MNNSNRLRRTILSWLFWAIALFVLYLVGTNLLEEGLSVTWLNVITTVLTLVVLAPLAIFSLTVHQPEGRLGIRLTQFLSWFGVLLSFIGVIGSIMVLYSELENKQQIAYGLAVVPPLYIGGFLLLFWVLVKLEGKAQ
jgi:magnesium-transporting ATPase (P-type)